MTPEKFAEIDDQLKTYEKKLDNYERQYLKAFQEEGIPKEYREYLSQTISWLRGKIDMLFGIKAGSLHQRFLFNEMQNMYRQAETIPEKVCVEEFVEEYDDGKEEVPHHG